MTPPTSTHQTLVGYADAARYLGVPLGTLYWWVAERCIPHTRLGPRSVRFDLDELRDWVARRHVPPAESSSRGSADLDRPRDDGDGAP